MYNYCITINNENQQPHHLKKKYIYYQFYGSRHAFAYYFIRPNYTLNIAKTDSMLTIIIIIILLLNYCVYVIFLFRCL